MSDPFNPDEYPLEEPNCIIRGRHVGWRIEADYDDTIYNLDFVISQIGGDTSVVIDGVRDGDYWVFEIPAATSNDAAWDSFDGDTECRWDMVLVRLSDNNEATLYSGFLTVYAEGSDRRTHAEIMVQKLNSVIEGRADEDIDSYTIGSRSVSRMSPKDLLYWRDYYLSELRLLGGSATDKNTKVAKNKMRVRFI